MDAARDIEEDDQTDDKPHDSSSKMSVDDYRPIGTPAADGVHYIEELAEGTWRIDEYGFVNCYLLAGDDRALLIDTGMGYGDVRATVRSLSDLPLDVVVTHRHCDHVGGSGWFDTCHVHRGDLRPVYALTGSRLASKTLMRMWKRMLDKMRKDGTDVPAFDWFSLDSLVFTAPARGARLVGIDESKVFHLGGRDISIVNTPGHTRGSIVLLDDARKLMFTGDDANPTIWMQLPGCTSLVDWVPGCERIIEFAKTYTPYAGHAKGLITREQIARMLEQGKELIATRKNTVLPHTAVYPSAESATNLTYNTARVH